MSGEFQVNVRGRSDDGQVKVKFQKFSELDIGGRKTCNYWCVFFSIFGLKISKRNAF